MLNCGGSAKLIVGWTWPSSYGYKEEQVQHSNHGHYTKGNWENNAAPS